MFYKSRKNRLRSPMGTQSILLFEEKTSDLYGEIRFSGVQTEK